jgi:molecular chaperone GrpE (heat shock protein)
MKGCQLKGGAAMKIDVQEELKRFQPFETDGEDREIRDLTLVMSSIMAQFQELKKADIKIIGGLHDLIPKITEAFKDLLEDYTRRHRSAETEKTDAVKDKVLFSIYDRLKNRLNVASALGNLALTEAYRKMLDDVDSLLAEELEWVPLEPVGKLYNPFEYEGFIAMDQKRFAAKQHQAGEIVNEVRTGFICRGQVLRKPVVEFFE